MERGRRTLGAIESLQTRTSMRGSGEAGEKGSGEVCQEQKSDKLGKSTSDGLCSLHKDKHGVELSGGGAVLHQYLLI